ncbi:MAG: glycosyltransferase [Myxococcota bacterium]
MKAVIAANGSRGDLQPMLVLTRALKARGHDVILAGTPSFAGWAAETGIPFQHSGTDLQAFLQSNRDTTDSPLAFFRRAWGMLNDEVESQFQGVLAASEGADLVVSGGAQISGGTVAVHRGAVHVAVAYVSVLLPSHDHAPPAVPFTRTPRWLNRLMWWAYDKTMLFMVRRALNGNRARLGLPMSTSALEAFAPHHLLLAADPEISPMPVELAPRCTQTAALTLVTDENLPPEVDAFIRDGTPPIYVGFGSMVDKDPRRTTQLLLDAVELAGVRAVISKGWAGFAEGALPSSCLAVGSMPHHALFPRMAAIVHHGGAGTTAAASRSGVPQVVVPHIADQFYFGHRVRTLGVGATPIPRTRLTAPRLAAAIQQCVSDETMRARARELAGRLAQRHGVEETVAFLERLAEQRRAKVPLALAG